MKNSGSHPSAEGVKGLGQRSRKGSATTSANSSRGRWGRSRGGGLRTRSLGMGRRRRQHPSQKRHGQQSSSHTGHDRILAWPGFRHHRRTLAIRSVGLPAGRIVAVGPKISTFMIRLLGEDGLAHCRRMNGRGTRANLPGGHAAFQVARRRRGPAGRGGRSGRRGGGQHAGWRW